MKLIQSEKGIESGVELVTGLKDGSFPKNYLTNHEEDFSVGLEEVARYKFNKYMGSCGCFLMDMRLQKKGCDYCG